MAASDASVGPPAEPEVEGPTAMVSGDGTHGPRDVDQAELGRPSGDGALRRSAARCSKPRGQGSVGESGVIVQTARTHRNSP